MNIMSEEKKKKSLNTFTLLFIIIAIVAAMTWIVPAGQYELTEAGGIIPGTYHTVEQNPQGLWQILTAPIRGMVGTDNTDGAIGVSLFILVIGGFLNVVTKTGAIDTGINSIIKNNEGNMTKLIWILMAIFALGGSTYGMSEETIPFYALLIPLMLKVGMDTVTAVAIVLVGSGLGVLSSTVNPFATGIAADMAGIGLGEGFVLRLIFLVVTYIIGATYVSRYAKRVQEDDRNSVMYDQLEEHRNYFKSDNEDSELTKKQKGVLILFIASFVIMILGLIPWDEFSESMDFFVRFNDWLVGVPFLGNFIGSAALPLGHWYLEEITMLFLVMSVVVGVYYNFSQDEIVDYFIDGTADLMSVALIVAVARGIQVVMNDGQITATILHMGEVGLSGLSEGIFITLVYLFFLPMTFLIASTSGLAAATMGIMGPLGDIAGVSPSLIVTTFQASSGLLNLVNPTFGVVMGALAVGKLGFGTWVKFIWKLILIIFVVSLALLVGAAILT